jgi:Arc/MetJ family transcription regulator
MDIKPNRKTWIIGTAGRGAVRLPPVLPAMTRPLIQDLTELFATYLAQTPDTAGLERELAMYNGMTRGLVQERRYRQLEKQLEEIRAGAAKAQREAASRARSYALNLCLVKGVRSFRVAGRCLGFTTAPIAIKKTVLGCYDVLIDLTERVPSRGILVRQHWARNDQGYHPHWNTNGPCFGYAGPFLERLLTAKRWPEVVGVMLTYLGTYNGGSPLIRLNNFGTGGMYYNPKSALPDDSRPHWWSWRPGKDDYEIPF